MREISQNINYKHSKNTFIACGNKNMCLQQQTVTSNSIQKKIGQSSR